MADEHVYVHDDGTRYTTGCLPRKHPRETFRTYADAGMPTYTEGEIVAKIRAGEGSLQQWVFAILNQTSYPWCWSFSAAQTLMVALNQLGYGSVLLDPAIGPKVTGVYGGNSIDACLKEVQVPFGAPDCTISGNDPIGGDVDPRRIPSDWQTNAALRNIPGSEVVDLNDRLTAASALIDGHPCVWGLSWQGGGHALSLLEVGFDEQRGEFLWAGPNSWGVGFASGWGSYPGRPGWYRLRDSQLTGAFDGFGAYALCGASAT